MVAALEVAQVRPVIDKVGRGGCEDVQGESG